MQESGLIDIIPFIVISAIWGQYPVFFTEWTLLGLIVGSGYSLMAARWQLFFSFLSALRTHQLILKTWNCLLQWHPCLLVWRKYFTSYAYQLCPSLTDSKNRLWSIWDPGCIPGYLYDLVQASNHPYALDSFIVQCDNSIYLLRLLGELIELVYETCLYIWYIAWHIACCSVTKSCLTLCDPMDCSTPGFPVLQCLLELAQTHVHWVHDAIQPSHPLSPPSLWYIARLQ